jgi:glucosyl-3-phosphoglycerate synthase
MNVEKWLNSRTFHHTEFRDLEKLVQLKQEQNLKISLGLPTLNEEDTIATEILVFRDELVDNFPILDEIAVIDSGSKDDTCKIAHDHGALVYQSSDCLQEHGNYGGKGENLWKSIYLLNGDIIIWIDADIKNIHPKFVYGLVGPLLMNPEISYIKAFYDRPIALQSRLRPAGGGRVSEIMMRPVMNLFFPELSGFIQPLSGEYAGRREILEQIPFDIGYGVEICLLIDILEKFGLDKMAQVDLDKRVHKNKQMPALTQMSFGILHAFFNKLEDLGKIKIPEGLNHDLQIFKRREKNYLPSFFEYSTAKRPPMVEIPEYRKKRELWGK